MEANETPRRRRPARLAELESELEEGNVRPLDQSEPIPQDELELDNIAEIEGLKGGSVSIKRKGPTEANYKYCQNVPASEYSIEWLQRTYGGGDYLLDLKRANGTFYRSKIPVSIDYRHKGIMDLKPDQPANAPVVIQGGQDNSGMMGMFQLMSQQAQASNQLMMTMMIESQKSMAHVIAAIVGGKNNAPPEPMHKLLEAATGLIGIQGKPGGSMSETLELVKTVKELFSGESPEKDDGIMGLIKQFAPALVPAFMGMMNQQRGGQTIQMPPNPPQHIQSERVPENRTAIPTPAGSQEVVVNDESPEMKKKLLIMALRAKIPMLVNAARRGSDPTTYYNLVDDLLNDSEFQQLVELLKGEDWLKVLFDEHPEVMQAREWFMELRRLFLEDDEPEAPPAPPAATATVNLTPVFTSAPAGDTPAG